MSALIGLSPEQRRSVIQQIHQLNLMDFVKNEIAQTKKSVSRLNASVNGQERSSEGNLASSSSENFDIDAEQYEKHNILERIDEIREKLLGLTETLRHPGAERYDQVLYSNEILEKRGKNHISMDVVELFLETITIHVFLCAHEQSSANCKSVEAHDRIESLIRASNQQSSVSGAGSLKLRLDRFFLYLFSIGVGLAGWLTKRRLRASSEYMCECVVFFFSQFPWQENKRNGNKYDSTWAKDLCKDEKSSRNNMKSKKKSNLNLDATPKSESKSGNRRKNLENHHGSGASARKMDRKRSQSPEQNSQNLARADDVEKPKENGGEQERIQACGTTDLSPDAVCNKEEDFHLKPSFPKICEESNSLQQMDKTVVGYPADHVPLHADISELGSNVAPKTPETPVTQEVVRECHGRLPPLPSFFFSV